MGRSKVLRKPYNSCQLGFNNILKSLEPFKNVKVIRNYNLYKESFVILSNKV